MVHVQVSEYDIRDIRHVEARAADLCVDKIFLPQRGVIEGCEFPPSVGGVLRHSRGAISVDEDEAIAAFDE